MTYFYGLIDPTHLVPMAVKVCNAMHPTDGYPPLRQNHDALLILETCAQETLLGQFRDPTPHSAGAGMCQVDPVGLKDVIARTSPNLKSAALRELGIDVDGLTAAHLEYSPVASLLVCRLFYRLRPEAIPHTLSGRAAFWKSAYNTNLGRGSAAEYIDNAKRFVGPLIGGYNGD